MPLQKLQFRPGVNRENTSYTNEGRWYECDKVRFRQGLPEKIGGWARISADTFLGVCRSLHAWVSLASVRFVGVGTHLKFYVERGGEYYDVTPIRSTTSAGDVTFAATTGSTTITVSDTAHGALLGDSVTFSGAVSLGGDITAAVLNQEYQITEIVDSDSYTITSSVAATASDTGNGGSAVVGAYQINVGPEFTVPLSGWSASTWGSGTWGFGDTGTDPIRLWSQSNFGEDLVFGPRGGKLYYWDTSVGTGTRAVDATTLTGASNVPTIQNFVFVSDVSRFVFCFGANTLGTSSQDPLLIRWSDQESVTNWTPAATNQAGDLTLSEGSEIITAKQARQEILVWTDAAVYSMQYVGVGSGVWSAQLVGDNISIASQNAVAYANGVMYWMGNDKFYKYDGRTQPLRCDLRRFIFDDFNHTQFGQVTAGTNEAFHEIWWFYASQDSNTNDRYVVYNYVEDVWYYGNLARTAWLDSGLRDYPLAATYNNNLVNHENGVDDNTTDVVASIDAYITSTQFDLDSGDSFSFVRRMLPDLRFDGSTIDNPNTTLTLIPMANSGSGYNTPRSVGGENYASVQRSATIPIEQYTEQVYPRVRGRQLIFKVESSEIGVQWQLGVPRIDLRPDGRR